MERLRRTMPFDRSARGRWRSTKYWTVQLSAAAVASWQRNPAAHSGEKPLTPSRHPALRQMPPSGAVPTWVTPSSPPCCSSPSPLFAPSRIAIAFLDLLTPQERISMLLSTQVLALVPRPPASSRLLRFPSSPTALPRHIFIPLQAATEAYLATTPAGASYPRLSAFPLSSTSHASPLPHPNPSAPAGTLLLSSSGLDKDPKEGGAAAR